MKAVIDRSGCIGCGMCAATCPEVFRMDEEGLAEVYGEVDATTEELCQEARDNCPVSVISIED
jgi:ferredoxin